MNDALQKQLAALIEKAAAAGQTAWDFAAEQAPELIQQLLLWKFWQNTLIAVFWLMFAALAGFLMRMAFTEFGKRWENQSEGKIVGGIVMGILAAVSSPFFFACVMNAIQIKLAPKIYLIEYISKLAK